MALQLSRKWLAGAASAAVIAAAPFVTGWEGWRNDIYKDQVGVSTVCAGHTDRIGTEKITKPHYTDEECGRILVKDLNKDEAQLRASIGYDVPLTQGQEVILIDFVHNLGVGALNAGSLRPLLLLGDVDKACAKILEYKYARIGPGDSLQEVKGLRLRREAENRVCTGQTTVEQEAALRGVVLTD
ncbi:lysozyme [Burkholderia seminalis]|uniref:lysozyme n=1 Tax=Burkholderia seminalis TaxID=488731 RepID=UPI00190641B7|nr:lysozyme [Burkholderia seminalis]MBJ9963701.1 lysozyme [Burkholderia seminalis]